MLTAKQGASATMPRGPRGEKRPADVIGAEAEELDQEPTNPAAILGKRGGTARARNLTAEQRTEIARKAATKRWKPDQGC